MGGSIALVSSALEVACAAVHRIETLDAAGVDRLEPLWTAMVEHHRAVSPLAVRTADEAWRRRRLEYEAWLADGESFVLVAVREDGGGDDGYVAVRIAEGSPTFDLGAKVGDLESLAVAERARGQGVGSLLIGAARKRLRAAGVAYWTVSAIDANPGALRLYEREGFSPFFRTLIATV
jgi:GNAT superfamily N-acetyltransferase